MVERGSVMLGKIIELMSSLWHWASSPFTRWLEPLDGRLLLALQVVTALLAVLFVWRLARRRAAERRTSEAEARQTGAWQTGAWQTGAWQTSGFGHGTGASAEPSSAVWRHMLAGLAAVLLLAGGVGGWAANADLAGAVIAQGTVVVESSVKKVQHPTGGIVGQIMVKDGIFVEAGEIVMRLDETQTLANLQIITKQLTEMAIRQQRLTAERDDVAFERLAAALDTRYGAEVRAGKNEALREMLEGEKSVYRSRASARNGQKAQLRERVTQLKEEIAGVTAQRAAKLRELDLVRRELGQVQVLEGKQLVPINRMTTIRREDARVDGEQSQLQASIAQARGKIAEIELQILQIDNDLRTEVSKELREIQTKEAEFNERRVAAEDQLKRIDIRAPQSGIVHQLAVHTVGGVINASEPVMLIVPEGDKLVVDARVAPQDIDQVREGQKAYVRFPAFNQRTTPETAAYVQRVSPDLTKDAQTNVSYYVARLELRAEDLAKLGDLELVPGMPAEVQVRTSDRTALSYLVKPLADQIARAFKER